MLTSDAVVFCISDLNDVTMPAQLKRTNPARRLAQLLDRGKALPQQGHNVQTGLASLFGVQVEDVAIIYAKFAGLLLLVEEVALRLQALNHPSREFYLRCIPAIRRALVQGGMNQQWGQVMNGISDSDRGLLHLAAEALDSVQVELEIPQADLDVIAKETNSLFDRVRSSQQLEPELRVILLDLLESIRRTIADYQIRGAEGLKKVLSECMGRLALDRDIVLRSEDKEEMKKFWELMKNLGALFSAANQAPQLGERIGDLITLTLK